MLLKHGFYRRIIRNFIWLFHTVCETLFSIFISNGKRVGKITEKPPFWPPSCTPAQRFSAFISPD